MADLSFDDLIPQKGGSAPAASGGLSFDDLIPKSRPTSSVVDDAVIRGAANIPGMLGGFQQLRDFGVDYLLRKGIGLFTGREMPSTLPLVQPDQFPSGPDIQKPIENAGIIAPKSSYTPAQKLIAEPIEGAVGGLAFGPAGAAYGALSGGAGEVAAQTLGENFRLPAQVITPMGAMAIQRLATASPGRILGPELAKLTDDQAVQARDLFDAAQQAGSPITVAEAVAQVTGGNNRLLAAQRVAEQSKGGAAVLEPIMNARGANNQTAFANAVEGVGPQVTEPANVVPRLQTAAEGVQQGAADLRNALTKPLYDLTTGNPQAVISEDALKSLQGNAAVAQAMKAVRADPVKYGDFSNVPDTNVGFLDAVQKYLGDVAQSAGQQGEKFAASNAGNLQRNVTGAITEQHPLYGVAREAQAQLFDALDRPVAQSQVGSLARMEAGDAEQRFGQASRILFPEDPKTVTPEAVTKAVRQLSFKDPTAARDFVRLFLESSFDKAVGGATKAPGFAGARFRDTIMGNPEQAANLEAAVKALPNGNAAWQGFQKLMDVFEAQGKRYAPGSPTEFNRLMTGELQGGAVRAVTKPLGAIQGIAEQFMYGRNTGKLAEALTNPDILRDLSKLRMMNPTSGKAIALANSIIAGSSILAK
jgi:hypothetical protein